MHETSISCMDDIYCTGLRSGCLMRPCCRLCLQLSFEISLLCHIYTPCSLCRMVKLETCDYIDDGVSCKAKLLPKHYSTSMNPAVIKAAGHDPATRTSVSLCNSKGSGCGHSRKAYDVAAAKSSAQTVRLPLSILCSSLLTLDLDPRSILLKPKLNLNLCSQLPSSAQQLSPLQPLSVQERGRDLKASLILLLLLLLLPLPLPLHLQGPMSS